MRNEVSTGSRRVSVPEVEMEATQNNFTSVQMFAKEKFRIEGLRKTISARLVTVNFNLSAKENKPY